MWKGVLRQSVLNSYNASLGITEEYDAEDLILIGIDVEQLFPSMNAEETAKIIRDEYIRSEYEVEEFSWEEASRYVAMNLGYDQNKDFTNRNQNWNFKLEFRFL